MFGSEQEVGTRASSVLSGFINIDVTRSQDARVSDRNKIHDAFELTSVTGSGKRPKPSRERIETGLLMIESSHKAKS